MLLQQIVNGIVIGSVYALTAMGATLVYGILRILDIANAGAYVVGAYIGWYTYLNTNNLIIAFLISMIITGLVGVLVQKNIYSPIINRPNTLPIVPLITSVGLFIFTEDLLRLIAGPEIKKFGAELPIDTVKLDKLILNPEWILIIVLTTLFLGVLWLILNKTKLGLAWKAAAGDSEITKAMGVNMKIIMASNFMIGYGFAAAAGIMIGILYNSIFPTMGDIPSYKMLAIIVLGGFGNPIGTVAAGLLIGLSETLVSAYIGSMVPRDAIAFIVLIIILLVKPNGLMSKKSFR